jgi:hypothetical protein
MHELRLESVSTHTSYAVCLEAAASEAACKGKQFLSYAWLSGFMHITLCGCLSAVLYLMCACTGTQTAPKGTSSHH